MSRRFLSPSLPGILLVIVLATSCVQLATSTCSQPQNPDHATLVYERHSSPPSQLPNGYTVRVVCDDLFQLVGGGTGFMTCSNGQWSNTFTCAVICGEIQSLPRGTIRFSAGGTIARYSCTSPGYRLEGVRKRRCMSDGTWSGERPRCRGIPMCEPPELEEHRIQQRSGGRLRDGLWTVGAILHFSCEETFTVVSDHYPAIECTRRGWNATLPICVEGRCNPLLDTIENGNSSAANRTYGPGEAIEFTCERGYRTTSPSWRVCDVERRSDGSITPVWEGITPQCEETECSRPKRIENGETIVFSTAIGGLTTFRCRSGFELIGDSVLSCQESGQWNGTIPVCDNGENDCPPLAAPLNGYKTGDRYSRYHAVEFSCESGYALAGSSTRECLFDGQWSGEEARCIGSLDFDDLNQISAVLGESLDRLAIDNLFENEVQQPASNLSQHGRFIPSQHEYGVDLYFLFDSSKSVGIENFEKSKRFARELVRKIGVSRQRNSLRVGAAYFSNNAQVAFHTVDFDSTDDVINQGINQIQYQGGGTNIAEALRLVNEVLIPQSNDREGSYKTVFLITDGEANEGGSPVSDARILEDQGVKIHCLGISPDASRQQLLAIGSKPHREHVFLLNDYNTLTDLVTRVVNETVDYSECGISGNTVSRGRVVGGNDANPGAWPWQVLLDMRKGLQLAKCGGVLIDRKWVLTAAHCLQNEEYSITVVLGNTDLRKPPHQSIEVEEIIQHPRYDHARFQNDIALIKLRTPAKLNAKVRLVCLPNKTRADKLIPPTPSSRHTATVTGWGHNKTRRVDEIMVNQVINQLQQLALPLKSREDCVQSLEGKDEFDYFDESMFCAGYLGSLLGACQGDSGGPLVKKAIRRGQRRWVLIGLTSWGRGCAVQNELDFFTNVPYFMDWVTETMNPPQEEGGAAGAEEADANAEGDPEGEVDDQGLIAVG